MIGGIDIHLVTDLGQTAIEIAVGVIQQHWREAVFENGLTGERYEQSGKIPFREIEELFVYRDEVVAEIWDEEGAVPSVSNTMIHLLSDPDMMTVVVDEKDAAMSEIIAAVEQALENESLHPSSLRLHPSSRIS